MTEHPSLLVVSAAPMSSTEGTGTTMTNLLHGWPTHKLAELHIDPTMGTAPHGRLRLPQRSVPLDSLVRSAAGRSRYRDPDSVAAPPTSQHAPPLRASAAAALDLTPLVIVGELRYWVRQQRPQVIYSPLGSIRMLRLVLGLSRRHDLPVLPHFMDDWPTTLYRHQIGGYARRTLDRLLDRVLARSVTQLCISPGMGREYEQRFGLPATIIGNPVSDALLSEPPSTTHDGDLVYVGGLHVERWRTLHAIATALAQLPDDGAGSRPMLVIHAPDTHRAQWESRFADLTSVRFGTFIPAHEVPARLRRAGALVHVESFDDAVRMFTRLSVSTKIPQYLASGRPVFAVGPGDVESVDLLRRNRLAAVCSSPHPGEIGEQLRQFLTGSGDAAGMTRRGMSYARDNYAASVVARKFRQAVDRSIGGAP
jgi:glycosyltransferase involved in cell wall biosynthesis